MGIKKFLEEQNVIPATFYSRIKAANAKGAQYPYPCREPFEQYLPLCYPSGYKKSSKKPITDFDDFWEKICERHPNDPDKRELAFLRAIQNLYPRDIEKDLEELQNSIVNRDTKSVYTYLNSEMGFKSPRGRPKKYTNLNLEEKQ